MNFDPIILYALAFAVAAVILDLLLGEPPNALHPVVWMGKLIGLLDGSIKRDGRVRRERAMGVFVALIPILVFVLGLTVLIAVLHSLFGMLVWAIACALLFKTLFAMKALERHVFPVMEALEKGDLEEARKKVSMVVSRDTSTLDQGHVASCAVETVAENTVDSIFSPFLFFGLAGVPGAVFYRVSNTLDAMVGYLSEKHRNVGWFSAKLDDATNWIGARLSLPFILLALKIMGKDWRKAYRTASRDHTKTASPNKGWPMAAFAGGLGIRMEKIGHYTFGDGPLPEDPRYIRETVKLAKGSSLLFFFLVALPLFLVLGLQVQLLFEQVITHLLFG